MSKMPYAESYRDLIVYEKVRQLALEIFELTKSFPKGEIFSVPDQIHRASRSVGAQITEAWVKRDYERPFSSELADADAEQQETQHWIDIGLDRGYLITRKNRGHLAIIN